MVTHQLQVERRTGKVRRPETDVLPLCHATPDHIISLISPFILFFSFFSGGVVLFTACVSFCTKYLPCMLTMFILGLLLNCAACILSRFNKRKSVGQSDRQTDSQTGARRRRCRVANVRRGGATRKLWTNAAAVPSQSSTRSGVTAWGSRLGSCRADDGPVRRS